MDILILGVPGTPTPIARTVRRMLAGNMMSGV